MKKVFFLAITAMLTLMAFRSSNDFVVSGQVTDVDGYPIPFATVRIKGEVRALSADQNGRFSLFVKSEKLLYLFTLWLQSIPIINYKL